MFFLRKFAAFLYDIQHQSASGVYREGIGRGGSRCALTGPWCIIVRIPRTSRGLLGAGIYGIEEYQRCGGGEACRRGGCLVVLPLKLTGGSGALTGCALIPGALRLY
jgi:hypothetical protein